VMAAEMVVDASADSRGRVSSVIQLDVPQESPAAMSDGCDSATPQGDDITQPLFKSNQGDVSLNYTQIPDLPEKLRAALAKHDVDKNGEISLAEVLNMAKANRQLSKTVLYLALALLLLLGSMFAVSWAAAELSNDTDTSGNVYIVSGTNNIVQSATATETIPTAYAPLLTAENLQRIKQLVIKKMQRFPGTDHSEVLKMDYVMKVYSLNRYNDTMLDFFGAGSERVRVDRGMIWITGMRMFPGETLEGCSNIECDAISVQGVDIAALEKRATQLGYAGTAPRAGDRRGYLGDLWKSIKVPFCDSNPPAQPWGVAFSGGGWRAQGAAFGFGRALYKSQTLPQVDTIASVSGGSWANVQMAFSERFYSGVEGTHSSEDLSAPQQYEADCGDTCKFYRQWMKAYYQVQSPEQAQENGNSMTATFSKFIGIMSKKYQGMMVWAWGNSLNWEMFITGMIDAYTPGLAQRQATFDNRQGQQHTDILVCTSLPTESQMSRNDGRTTIWKNGEASPDRVMPIGLVIPGKNRGNSQAHWFSPQQPLDHLEVKTNWNWWWQSSTHKLHIPIPSVGKVAAASSAAVGFMSSPPMLKNAAESALGEGLADAAFHIAKDAGLQDLGVCTGPDMHNCEFPSMRLMDGGMTDDSAIALLVAKLQKSWGMETTLRVAALNSDECDPPKTAGGPKDCKAGSAYNFGTLFEGVTQKIPGLQGWETGQAWMGAGPLGNQLYVETINTTIFESMNGATIGQEIQDGNGMTYTMTTLITTDAPKWGIKAGSTVEILELHINSLLGDTPLGIAKNQHNIHSAESTTHFGLLAQNVEEVLTRTDALKTFFNNGPTGVKFQKD